MQRAARRIVLCGRHIPDYRVVRTMPVLFSPVNPRKLYFSSNVLWQTVNGGRSWDRVPADRLPAALPGEGAYAASGTNVVSVVSGR